MTGVDSAVSGCWPAPGVRLIQPERNRNRSDPHTHYCQGCETRIGCPCVPDRCDWQASDRCLSCADRIHYAWCAWADLQRRASSYAAASGQRSPALDAEAARLELVFNRSHWSMWTRATHTADQHYYHCDRCKSGRLFRRAYAPDAYQVITGAGMTGACGHPVHYLGDDLRDALAEMHDMYPTFQTPAPYRSGCGCASDGFQRVTVCRRHAKTS